MMQSISGRKRYPLKQSPFYRLKGKDKLETLIQVPWNIIPKLLDSKNYHVWSNKNGREIQAPHGLLKQVHQRLGNLLARIELPDYIYSQKGRCYTDNARAHRGSTPLVKTDIHHFYPSITRQAVFRMFLDDFECSADIAHRLADICCYNQAHLPTGSPLSGRVAFFAKRQMFDEIAKLAEFYDCKMTVYVDDITISGLLATKSLLGKVRQIIGRHGLRTQNKKSRSHASGAAKLITGTVIVRNEVRLPNARHLKIHRARQELNFAADSGDRHRLQEILNGRLQEARQVLKQNLNNQPN